MEKKFTLAKTGVWIDGIRYGDQHVAQLVVGTTLNERFAEWLVDVLNGKRSEPPYEN